MISGPRLKIALYAIQPAQPAKFYALPRLNARRDLRSVHDKENAKGNRVTYTAGEEALFTNWLVKMMYQ